MKKLLIFSTLLFSIITVKAQEEIKTTVNYEKHNELKLNGVMLLAGAFEAVYERNLNKESSAGISVLFPFDKENLDTRLNYYISPYYRIFFGEKYAAGFFVEGFGMLNSIEEREALIGGGSNSFRSKNVSDFALGFGLGGKWVSKSGFVFELNGGLGRNLFNNQNTSTQLVGKFGFNLGYRF
ncbi:DUF3575 domain-containing protein [Lacinutrix sp. Bg11-31]|uniref:DUF3575 domain-containing protein n=1 Tax=Lacinutrix sp. Bg11-31 TaxID=2057808 RepID=UPI000C311941|nr:DUF3575 domain-containing protein [Lacinutrix sp. Bg11-31]AUC82740.1 DUF3575 domain-containing protein [Lacinutrix sp. Bg11-31]